MTAESEQERDQKRARRDESTNAHQTKPDAFIGIKWRIKDGEEVALIGVWAVVVMVRLLIGGVRGNVTGPRAAPSTSHIAPAAPHSRLQASSVGCWFPASCIEQNP